MSNKPEIFKPDIDEINNNEKAYYSLEALKKIECGELEYDSETLENFDKIIQQCFEVFQAWDDEYEKFQTLLRDIVKKKRDEHLLEVYYDTLPELEEIDKNLKMITGVIETSLFYQVATKALVAGEEGIRVIK